MYCAQGWREKWVATLKGLQASTPRGTLKDTQWHENRSLQPTVLPLGHSAFTSINLSTLFFVFFHSLLPPLSFASHKTLCLALGACISEPHAAVRPALPSVYIRHTNTEPVMCSGLHCRSAEHKQPLAPWAENDFTHSISLPSIMTVCQRGEAASSEPDADGCDVPSAALRMVDAFPQINAWS